MDHLGKGFSSDMVLLPIPLHVATVQGGAISLLLNLGGSMTRKEPAVLDEQKLLFEGSKKRFVKNTNLDLMRR